MHSAFVHPVHLLNEWTTISYDAALVSSCAQISRLRRSSSLSTHISLFLYLGAYLSTPITFRPAPANLPPATTPHLLIVLLFSLLSHHIVYHRLYCCGRLIDGSFSISSSSTMNQIKLRKKPHGRYLNVETIDCHTFGSDQMAYQREFRQNVTWIGVRNRRSRGMGHEYAPTRVGGCINLFWVHSR